MRRSLPNVQHYALTHSHTAPTPLELQTRKRERNLYREIVRTCGHTDQWGDVLRLVLVFKEGKRWDEHDVNTIATRESPPGKPTSIERLKKCSTCLCDACAC